MNHQHAETLPPLPTALHYAISEGKSVPLYTEAQMREYARAAAHAQAGEGSDNE